LGAPTFVFFEGWAFDLIPRTRIYFSLQDYPQAVAYAHRVLMLIDKGHSNGRLEALLTRAMAYSAGCNDSAFQTPEASAKAANTAAEGLELVSQLPKPPLLADEIYAVMKTV
jgi:hypothetical protein